MSISPQGRPFIVVVVVLLVAVLLTGCGGGSASGAGADSSSSPSMSSVVAILRKAGFEITLAGPPTKVEDALLTEPGHRFTASYFILGGPGSGEGDVMIWHLASPQQATLAGQESTAGSTGPLSILTSEGSLVVRLDAIDQAAVGPLKALQKRLAAAYGS